jgi:hypothetical protein
MASKDSLIMRHYAASSKVARILDDQPVAIRISYSGASTTAPVISVITATSLTLTTSIGATVFTFATFTTMNALVNAINAGIGDGGLGAAGGGFYARLMDALPTTITTASNIVVSAGLVVKTVNGEAVYDAMLDTSTTKMIAYRVAYDRNVNINRKLANGHRVAISGFSYVANISSAEAGAIRIYEYDKQSGDTTLVWANVSVDQSTGGTFDFSANPYTAQEGGEFLVMVMDTTSVTDDSTNFLQVSYIRE